MQNFIAQALSGIVYSSAAIHAGSHYEHSALHHPSNSDFDIQFPLLLSASSKTPCAKPSHKEGQMKVKYGPEQFLDDKGFYLARRFVTDIYLKFFYLSLSI